MNHFYKTFLLLFLFFNISSLSAQQDTIRPIGFSGIPILASSPETGFKYGVFGQVSFDLYKNNIESRPSQLKIGASYSVKKQLSIVSTPRGRIVPCPLKIAPQMPQEWPLLTAQGASWVSVCDTDL